MGFTFYHLIIVVMCATKSVIHLHAHSLHINRYFLPIDSIFDYMKQHLVANPLIGITSQDTPILQEWIYQPLDHFNPVEERKFRQKYLFVTSANKTGPVCVYIGGDAAIHEWWLRYTFLSQKCLTFNGNLFLLEHRFFGESIPMNGLTVGTLRYLTISQALEDTARFISYIRRRFNLERSKLFVFGASYGGTLAALFRRKYYHLADAAVAMSAPMKRSYENKEYLPSIGKKIEKTNRKCFLQIEHGLRQAARLLENHICIKKDMPLCDKILGDLGLCASSLKGMTKLERQLFYGILIKDFTFLTEYDGVLNVTLQNVCDAVDHPSIASWTPLNKLLAADIIISQELFQSKTRSGECLYTRQQAICSYLAESNSSSEAVVRGNRQRLWQSCIELGSFKTANGDSRQHPFGKSETLPEGHFQDFCRCAFGEIFTEEFTKERLYAFSRTFGQSSPYLSSRIIYTIGENDPVLQRELRSMDKQLSSKSKFNDSVVYKVKGSPHCGEVFLKPTRKRLKAKHVAQVQESIVEQLAQWLNFKV